MDNPITQYIQHLIIDTVTAVTHLGTTIHIALLHMKMSQIKNQTQQTFNTKDSFSNMSQYPKEAHHLLYRDII